MNIKKTLFSILIIIFLIEKVNSKISDALFMTIGDKAIAQSDVVNEIKTLLILSNESYSDQKREELQKLAINSIIKRKIKEIEVDRNNYFKFNNQDLQKELERLAANISVDVETLENICASNELDFSLIKNNIKIDLRWNGLIFDIYKNRLAVTQEEIDEKLKVKEKEKKLKEYLISEILINPVPVEEISSTIEELKQKISLEGFENVAKNLGISESSTNGGDMGWIREDKFALQIKPIIINTPKGQISEPVILDYGILIFKVRDKREIKNVLSLEQKKNQIANIEKIKILKMHSLSHYDKVRRSVSIKFLKDE
tara:strand:+ start:120 stop:1061 length:942 start_codon:yes stop_codon:yes gene_type:complete